MANQKHTKIERPFFQNLDALRFLAAFSVFLFHFINELKGFIPIAENNLVFKVVHFFTSKGMLGVNFFFVLSGFLITYLILFEIKQNQTFSLRNFLIRRTLRIWPLYFIIILIGFLIFPLVFNNYQTNHNLINYALFLANFDEIWYGKNDAINFLTSPWSVAVEEQFYLFWGTILFILNRLKVLKIQYIILVLFVITLIFRINNFNDERIIYYHTLSVMPDILIGSIIANAYFNKVAWIEKLKNLNFKLIALIYIVGFTLILFKTKIFIGPAIVFERYLIGLFFGFVLLDQVCFKNSFFKFGKIQIFNSLGKISYGIYMYHLIVMFVLQKAAIYLIYKLSGQYYLVSFGFFLASIIITFMISKLSFVYLEKPLLKLKDKFV